MMMALLHTVLFALTVAAVYYLPGRLLLTLGGRPARSEEIFPLSLGLGLVLVNVPTVFALGAAGMSGLHFLAPWMLWLGSGLLSLVLLLLRLRRGPRPQLSWPARPTRNQVALWLVTAAAFSFFLVHYDDELFDEEACQVRASMAVVADTLQPELLATQSPDGELTDYQTSPAGGEPVNSNSFIAHNQGQRLGPTFLLAPFVSLFGTFGARLLYGLQGLLLPGLGFLLGLYVLRRTWAAWLVALGLTFNPYSLEIRIFDINFLALTFSSLALVLLVRPQRSGALVGLAMSLFLGIRHIGVLLVPGVLWQLGASPRRARREVWRFCLVLLVFCIPYILKHLAVAVFGPGQLLESTTNRPLAPHSFFGLEFQFRALLDFPFLSEPHRSPYQGFPNLLAFPLSLVGHFGVLLIGLIPAGVARLRQLPRATAWLLALWVLPIYAVVMVQSNWTEPNKMGVPVSTMAPVVLTMVAGLVFVVDRALRWWRRALVLVAGLAAPLVLVPLATSYRAPLDQRVLDYQPFYVAEIFPEDVPYCVPESEAYLAWEQQRYGTNLLPDVPPDAVHPVFVGLGVERTLDNLARPWLSDYHANMTSLAARFIFGWGQAVSPVTLAKFIERGRPDAGPEPMRFYAAPDDGQRYAGLAVDLGAPPSISDAAFERTAATPDLPPLDGSAVQLVTGIDVSWSAEAQSLLLARDRLGAVLMIFLPGWPRILESPPEWLEIVHLARAPGSTAPLVLSLPAGEVIRLFDIRCLTALRFYIRTLVLDDEDVWVSPPRPLSSA